VWPRCTGSSHFRPSFPEQPYADLTELGDARGCDTDHDEPTGAVDAQLLTLLAWAVRTGVLEPLEAQWLTRIYLGRDRDGEPAEGPAVAAELGISWVALRQRCHRLARRLGQAAEAAGLTRADLATSAVAAA
jgi:hypothetical protein